MSVAAVFLTRRGSRDLKDIRNIPEPSRAGFRATAVAAMAALAWCFGAASAAALTATGTPVGTVGSNTTVGLPFEYRPLLDTGDFDGNAIKYYIPLHSTTGTYGTGSGCKGAGYGTCADTGDDSGQLTMILRFTPVSKTENSTLRIIFEDLDLKGVNDPGGFLEKFKLQAWNGTKKVDLTEWITNITSALVDGDNDTQILELALGKLTTDPLYLLLNFKSIPKDKGTNTPEYLIAMVTSPNPAPPPSEVPLPGAIALFGTVLAGSWGADKWRRRRGRGA